MADDRTISTMLSYGRSALGYACVCAWAAVLLLSPAFESAVRVYTAPFSMLPGLVSCLASIFCFRRFPSIAGRTAFTTVAALLTAVGTLLCMYPPTAALPTARIAGLALSGFFAIIVIMAWFDAYARLRPRVIIVLAGSAASIAAALCWAILSCPQPTASILVSLLPMISFVMLPAASSSARDAGAEDAGGHDVLDVVAAAVPARTLIGLAITFFVVSSVGALAPGFGSFNNAVTPWSLVVPLSVSAFLIASAFFARRRIDLSLLYKILLSAFAAGVFLLAATVGISASLVFYATIIADVITWIMLALWAKKTPVQPHLVFAFAWVAECVGNTLGQITAPLFASQPEAFFAVVAMLVLVAIGFAFSEGHLVLDIDFVDERDNSDASEAQPAEAEPTDGSPSVGGPDLVQAFASAHDLSPREREVFALWVTGHGLRHIENTLFISESTVKTHLRSIYRKCDTHNRAEIIALFEEESARA